MDVATGHVASSIRSVANQRIRRVASSPLDAPVRLSVWNGSHPFPPRFIPFPCVPPYPSARRMVNAVILSSDPARRLKIHGRSTLVDGHQRDRPPLVRAGQGKRDRRAHARRIVFFPASRRDCAILRLNIHGACYRGNLDFLETISRGD